MSCVLTVICSGQYVVSSRAILSQSVTRNFLSKICSPLTEKPPFLRIGADLFLENSSSWLRYLSILIMMSRYYCLHSVLQTIRSKKIYLFSTPMFSLRRRCESLLDTIKAYPIVTVVLVLAACLMLMIIWEYSL